MVFLRFFVHVGISMKCSFQRVPLIFTNISIVKFHASLSDHTIIAIKIKFEDNFKNINSKLIFQDSKVLSKSDALFAAFWSIKIEISNLS